MGVRNARTLSATWIPYPEAQINRIQKKRNPRALSRALERTGFFTVLSDTYRLARCVRCTSTISNKPLDRDNAEVYSLLVIAVFIC